MTKNTNLEKELKTLLTITGLRPSELVNTESQLFKKMNINLDEKKEQEIMELLLTQPRIIPRPILTNGKQALIWFNEEEYGNIMEEGSFFNVETQ